MRLFFLILSVLLLLHSQILPAQKPVIVDGRYVFHAPATMSLLEAKKIALDRAKISALADRFGTVIESTSAITVSTENGVSDINQQIIGENSIKGEWLETIGEPDYHIYYNDYGLIVECRVKGRAREITSSKIDLKVKILCNGTDDKYETTDFHDGDDLYMSFSSPVSGFLAVYLYDGKEDVYCLLPYRSQSSTVRVDSGEKYLFFSSDNPYCVENPTDVDEYVMTSSADMEANRIYVIFSTNEFFKANDSMSSADGSLPRVLPYVDFVQWLSKNRSADKNMRVEVRDLIVIKK